MEDIATYTKVLQTVVRIGLDQGIPEAGVTLEKIEEWCEEGDFAIDDALEFIATYGEDDFVTFYEDYIEQGEKVGYEVVDAYIEYYGVCRVDEVEEAYAGLYSTAADFAEEFYTDTLGYDIPVELVIDWEATWESSLRFDYDFVEAGYRVGYVFRNCF